MSHLTSWYPGDAIVNFFVIVTATVTVVSAAAWMVSLFLERQPAVRYWVLLSALVASLASPLLACAFIASGTSFISVPLLVAVKSPIAMPAVRESETHTSQLPPPLADPAKSLPAAENPSPARAPVPEIARPSTENLKTTEVIPVKVVSTAAEQRDTKADGFRSIVVGVFVMWICGTIVCIVGLLRSSLFLRRLRRSLQPISDSEFDGIVEEATRLVGARTSPTVMVSQWARTPMVAGLFRPVIVLPVELPGAITREQLCDVLMHEIAHVERRDNLIVLMQAIAKAFFWPIPFVHLLNRQLARAREEVCDNFVLARRDAVNYGETLLRLAQLASGASVPSGTVGILHWRGKLEQRILGLIHKGRSKLTRTHPIIAMGVLVLFLAASALLCTTTILSARAAEQNKVATTQKSSSAADSAPDPEDAKFAGHFSGKVRGPDGKPVSGARIYIVPIKLAPKDAGPVRATTGADGHFEFDAPDMTYAELDGLPARREGLLMVTADGYAPDWFETWGQMTGFSFREDTDPVKGAPLDMHLAADDAPIHGRFLDPEGKPLANARVELTRIMIPTKRNLTAHLDRESKASMAGLFMSTGPDYERRNYWPKLMPGLNAETQTDADGRFTMSGIGRDRIVELKVSAPGVVDTTLKAMTREGPDVRTRFVDAGEDGGILIHSARFTHQLKPGRTIKGRVIDRDTRKPVAGMWVGPLAYYGMSSDLYPLVTGEDGRFTIIGQHLATTQPVVLAFAAPGVPYQSSGVEVGEKSDVVIESRRGIPFRLKVVDEDEKPVEAEVTYVEVKPNPNYVRPIATHLHMSWPNNPAARRDDGSYEGFVIPGPGAVMVKTPRSAGYRPAFVNPKAFFAPGKMDWTAEKEKNAYGDVNTIETDHSGALDQRDYAAIVLVNPPKDSAPLELTARIVRDKPRMVSLVDSDGKPVVGAEMEYDNWRAPRLRSATFPLTKLHPDRERRITFTHKDRELVGYLVAKGDGDAPYTVPMEHWASITGRLVDENGEALPIWKPESDHQEPPKLVASVDGETRYWAKLYVDANYHGKFRIDKLIPGLSYSAAAYRHLTTVTEPVFENLKLKGGEVRDLGDVRVKKLGKTYEPHYNRPAADDQKAAANIPAEAWGEPINGLRVAIVLESPAINDADQLLYNVVAENVSDHDIRFSAASHVEFSYCKIVLTDADGKQPTRKPGALPNWEDHPRVYRHALKPKERVLISRAGTHLVKLDDAGKPHPSTQKSNHYHWLEVKPGQYTLSAEVELGSGMEYVYPTSGTKELHFAAKGEWTGKLKTGVVTARLFEAARK